MKPGAPSSPFMTLHQAADYLRYAHKSSALRWLRKNDVRMFWRGESLLVRQVDIDRALERHATGDTVARARKVVGL